jgi:hypothetical protein
MLDHASVGLGGRTVVEFISPVPINPDQDKAL